MLGFDTGRLILEQMARETIEDNESLTDTLKEVNDELRQLNDQLRSILACWKS